MSTGQYFGVNLQRQAQEIQFSLVTSQRTQEILNEKKSLSSKKLASSNFLMNVEDKKAELRGMLSELEKKERKFQSPDVLKEMKIEKKDESRKESKKEFAKHILVDQVYEHLDVSESDEEFKVSVSFSDSENGSNDSESHHDYPEGDSEDDDDEDDDDDEEEYDDDAEDAM